MKTYRQRRLVLSMLLVMSAQPVHAISISFDYSYDQQGFFDDARRATLNQAGTYVGSRLQDQLTAIDSSGTNNFTAKFSNPSDFNSSISVPAFSVAANDIRVYVGASDMGSDMLGNGGPGGFSVSGDEDFVNNALSRGQTGVFAAPVGDFGPWGGMIGFNSASDWYFDQDASTVEEFGNFDFFSVAVHELAHIVGFGTSASWDANVNGLTFTGVNSQLSYGEAVPLDLDLGHWVEGTLSTYNGFLQNTAMEPVIAAGQRKYLTDLDFAAVRDVGWQVSTPIPEPSTLLLLISGVSLLAVWGKRKAAV